MGQKVHPMGFRVGITEDWLSRWYAPKSAYGDLVVEDHKIRRFLDERLDRRPPFAALSKVEIERTRDEVKVTLHTARPGLVIGPRGAEVEKIKEALEDLIERKVSISIMEIKVPDADAQLVAEGISEQLKKRAGFRRVMKQRAEASMNTGIKCIKILCKGRLGGSEMSRREKTIMGSIPLHTLQAHIDYGFTMCRTTYGAIGIKVWLYHGRYGEEATLEQVPQQRGRGEGRRGKRG